MSLSREPNNGLEARVKLR